jgi:hypothetical protein
LAATRTCKTKLFCCREKGKSWDFPFFLKEGRVIQ